MQSIYHINNSHNQNKTVQSQFIYIVGTMVVVGYTDHKHSKKQAKITQNSEIGQQWRILLL